jgi:acetyl esterase/lipase
VSPYAAPARADDLRGLAPAFIGVGTLDVFRDENIEYARRLLEAGVSTELHVYPGAPHGFEGLAPKAVVSQQFARDILEALRRALNPRS